MIIFFPFMFFIYRILYECHKICNKKIITFKEYKKIDYLKILNNIKLILVWCFLINITSITTRVTTIFPVWLILFFIYSFKEILNLFFKDIEKQKMIIFFPFMFFIYRILYECHKICNKKIIISKEYKKIDYLKILNNIKLILVWCFLINITSIITRVTTIFPVWLILFFIYSFKEILNLFFKDIEKQKMDGFILFFFILVFCLSLGNLDLKNILGIIPITFL